MTNSYVRLITVFLNKFLSYYTYFTLSQYQDATAKILELMDCKPDLIIGNYSDGNLVASLMASKLGVTQVRTISS